MDKIELARYIEVIADVRYWDDANVNGEVDIDGKIPLRDGNSWHPIIDIFSGQILGWPIGTSASVHYKVCDAGDYWLLDENKERILKWYGQYVPDDVLCVDTKGYGDYIIFQIDTNGKIINWKVPYFSEKWIEKN
jgi:hypothetical protein